MVEHESTEQLHRDPVAWQQLIETLESGTLLAAISTSMSARLKQHYPVEDIWQETLIMAWRDGDKHEWSGVRNYRAWLLSIARNRMRDASDRIDAQRRGGGETIDTFSTLAPGEDDSVGHLLPPESTTPSRVAAHAERIEAMESALAALPAELRDVVRLSLFDELPLRAVAERLELGASTIKRRLLEGATGYRAELERRLGSMRGGS